LTKSGEKVSERARARLLRGHGCIPDYSDTPEARLRKQRDAFRETEDLKQ
jgi:hypothetical protein